MLTKKLDQLLHIFCSILEQDQVPEDTNIWNVSPLICFQNDLPLETAQEVRIRVRKISVKIINLLWSNGARDQTQDFGHHG